MKNTYLKKSLSLILSVCMILSCWVFVEPHDHTHANAAIENFEVELAFDNIFVFDKWANNALSTTIVNDTGPVKNTTLTIDMTNGSFTFNNPDTAKEAYTGHGMGTGLNAAGNYQYYYMEVEPVQINFPFRERMLWSFVRRITGAPRW